MPSAAGLRAGKAVIELSLLTKGVEKSLRNLQARAKGISRSFLRIGTGGMLGGGGSMGGFNSFAALRNLFVGSAAATALAWPVKLAANLEVTQARFTALLGSAELARETVSQLEEFAPRSFLPTSELQEGAAWLAQSGIAADQLIPSIKSLAAIAGGNAERFQRMAYAFGQIRTANRLLSTEARQLAEAGFNPLEEIAKATGETIMEVRKRMEAGAVSFNELERAIYNSTAVGGRFHGLLGEIASTATGQWNKLRTSILLAIRPLGQVVLPVFTRLLTSINGAMPAIAAFIKAHSSLAIKILSALIATAALATAFVSVGLAMVVLGIASAGIVILFKAILATVLVLIHPVTLLTALLGYLVIRFTDVEEVAASLVNTLSGYFGRLLTTAYATFGGIADALSAGEIQLAGRVAMAGLNLAWLEGTQALREKWHDFKDVFLRTTIDLVFDAMEVWNNFSTSLKQLWSSLVTESASIGEQIGHYLTRSRDDPELAAAQDAAHRMAMANIAAEGQARVAAIAGERMEAQNKLTADRKAAMEDRNATATQERKQARGALKAAQAELDAAREESRKKAEEAGRVTQVEAARRGKALASAPLGGTTRNTPGGIFDTRFARQLLGTPQDKQVTLLTKIERNTRSSAPPGVPAV